MAPLMVSRRVDSGRGARAGGLLLTEGAMYGVHPRDTLMDLDASLGGGVFKLLTTSFVKLE